MIKCQLAELKFSLTGPYDNYNPQDQPEIPEKCENNPKLGAVARRASVAFSSQAILKLHPCNSLQGPLPFQPCCKRLCFKLFEQCSVT